MEILFISLGVVALIPTLVVILLGGVAWIDPLEVEVAALAWKWLPIRRSTVLMPSVAHDGDGQAALFPVRRRPAKRGTKVAFT